MRRQWLAVLVGIQFLTAAATANADGTNNPATAAADNTSTPTDDIAYYVIGVAPESVDLVIQPGDISTKDGDFDRRGSDNTPQTPVSGFIVGRLEKEDTLAITEVMMETDQAYGHALGGMLAHYIWKKNGITLKQRLFSCGRHSQAITFKPLANKVLYITDIDFTLNDPGYWGQTSAMPTMHSDIEKARAFLKEHYPMLADRLEQGSYEMRHVSYGCY